MSDKKPKLKIVKTKTSKEDDTGHICSFCGKNARMLFVGPNEAIICEKCVLSAIDGFSRVV